MILFKPLTQMIADYLNRDGRLDERKLLFCILSTACSGGIIGILLIILLMLLGLLSPLTMLIEFVVVIIGGTGDALMALWNLERKEDPSRERDQTFEALCLVPMILYIIFMLALFWFYF